MIGEIIGAGLGAAGAAIQHGYNEDAMNLQVQNIVTGKQIGRAHV